MFQELHGKFALCAAVTAVSLLSAGCGKEEDRAAWWQQEREKIELSHQLELKTYRLEQLVARSPKDSQKPLNTGSAALVVSLRQRKLALAGDLETLENQRSAFRELTLQDRRQQALGKTFEVFKLSSGREYQQVAVTAINDAGVTIRHANGSARLRYEDLDDRQRTFFGLEADLAVAAQDKESKNAAVYERWIDDRLATVAVKEKKDSAAADRKLLAARRKESLIATQQAAIAAARPLAQPATSVGNSGYYSNYRTSRFNYYDTTPSYYYTILPVVPTQRPNTIYVDPPVVKKHKSFADTTIPTDP